MGKKNDLTGKRFGRLLVIAEAGKTKYSSILWRCYCDCENYSIVIGSGLTSGNTKSCGCLGREKRLEKNTIHGMCDTREYTTWCNMLSRCNNPKKQEVC